MIKVLVNGALGKMGSTVVRTVLQQEDMELISAVDVHGAGKTVEGVPVDASLEEALIRSKPDVVVDFTRPDVVMDSLRIITSHGVNAVVGTTGFSPEDLEEVKGLAEKNGVGVLICPNFAIGAVLMMKAAEEIAKYLPQVEIIELHHDQKLDAPSGTAMLTAAVMWRRAGKTKQRSWRMYGVAIMKACTSIACGCLVLSPVRKSFSEAWVNASSSAMIPSTVTATCLVLCWDVGPWLNAGALCMGWMQFCKEAFLI